MNPNAESLEAFLLNLRESEGFAIGLDELLKVRSLLRRLQAAKFQHDSETLA